MPFKKEDYKTDFNNPFYDAITQFEQVRVNKLTHHHNNSD